MTFSTKPTTAGSLTAVVTTDSVSSGAAVQVAHASTPVVTSSTANLAANAATLTINGFGFDTTAANNTVIFNDGAVGTVTAATATALDRDVLHQAHHRRQPDGRGHDRRQSAAARPCKSPR